MAFNLNYVPSITINFLIPLTKALLAIFACCYFFLNLCFFKLVNGNFVIKICGPAKQGCVQKANTKLSFLLDFYYNHDL